jgi:hypothetical protein
MNNPKRSILSTLFMLASRSETLRVRIQIYGQLTFPFVLLFSIVVPWIFYRLGMPRVA